LLFLSSVSSSIGSVSENQEAQLSVPIPIPLVLKLQVPVPLLEKIPPLPLASLDPLVAASIKR